MTAPGIKIGNRQFFYLIFLLVVTSSFTVPELILPLTGRDVWLAMIGGLILDLLVALILYLLGRQYPGETMVQYSESILGPFAGKIAAALFITFFMLTAANILRITTEFLATAVYPKTPTIILVSVFVLVALQGAYYGLEVISRLGELLGPLLIFALFFLIISNINNIRLENLTPILLSSWKSVALSSLIAGANFGICVVMGMIIPYHNQPRQSLAVKGSAVVTGVLAMILELLTLIAVFGPESANAFVFPFYSLAGMISIGEFIINIEVLELVIWLGSSLTTFILFLYFSALGIGQLFRFQDYHLLLMPLAILITSLSLLLAEDLESYFQLIGGSYTLYSLAVVGFLPLLLLIISYLRN